MSSRTANMKKCDERKKNNKEKNYHKLFDSQKHKYNSGEIRKIFFSLCNITLFAEAYEKHFHSYKHLSKSGQKIDAIKVKFFMEETTDKKV